MAKRAAFMKAWVKAPLKMGAIVPSSHNLARSMASQAKWDKGMIIELGAGTGAITLGLLQAGIPADKLIIMEREKKLVDILHKRFPSLNIVRADATHLVQTLKDLKIDSVQTIISSLPLLSMPKTVEHTITSQMLKVVGDKGQIVQYTYGPSSPLNNKLLIRYGLHAHKVKRVWRNIPPATVWRYDAHQ